MISPEELRRRLSALILGQKGGQNRTQIIDLVRVRPYNLNRMAEELELNYRTIKHHVGILVNNDIIMTSRSTGYGDTYFLTPLMESNMAIFDEIVEKLRDITSAPTFFRDVVEQTANGVMVVDESGETYFWNDGAERMFGYSENEVLGNRLPIFHGDGDFDRTLMNIAKGREVEDLRTTARHKSGSPLHVSLSVSPIENAGGSKLGYSIMTRDISGDVERLDTAMRANRMLETIREIERMMVRAEDFEELAAQAAHILSRDGGYGAVNVLITDRGGSGIRICGSAGDDMSGGRGAFRRSGDEGWRHLHFLTGPDPAPPRVLESPNAQACPVCGNEYAHEILAFPMMVRDRSRGALVVCGGEGVSVGENELELLADLSRDLSYTHFSLEYEARLEESMNRYRDLFEGSNDAIMLADPETGEYLDCNQRALELTGLKREELLELSLGDLTCGKDRHMVDGLLRHVGRDRVHRSQRRIRGPGGAEVAVEETLSIVNAGGRDVVMVILRDMTERVRLVAEAEATRERLERSLKAAGMGAWDWDIENGGLKWSNGVEKIFGMEPDSFTGTYEEFLELVHPEDREIVEKGIAECLDRRTEYDVVHRIVTPGGEVRRLRETGDVHRDRNGKAVSMSGVVRVLDDGR